jgi:hypothetical protein
MATLVVYPSIGAGFLSIADQSRAIDDKYQWLDGTWQSNADQLRATGDGYQTIADAHRAIGDGYQTIADADRTIADEFQTFPDEDRAFDFKYRTIDDSFRLIRDRSAFKSGLSRTNGGPVAMKFGL